MLAPVLQIFLFFKVDTFMVKAVGEVKLLNLYIKIISFNSYGCLLEEFFLNC